MFLCNYLSQELTYYRNAEMPTTADADVHPRAVTQGEAVTFPIVQAEPLRLELRSFFEAVRGEHPVEVDGEAGLRALHLAQALVASASASRVFAKRDLESLWVGGDAPAVRGATTGSHSDDL
jgi:predicted dehydrogenase